ncbi:MAG TPA: N-acetylmuramoyl-L-alanine amidase [Chloroflexota bacterium]|nr:N-acetylmuramoyl-L-alanine amidase [Chloroflexota bacterium]
MSPMSTSFRRLVGLLCTLVVMVAACAPSSVNERSAFLSVMPIGQPTETQTPIVATPTPPIATLTPMPASNPTKAMVFLDPGHGGVDTGTIGQTLDGQQVEEKNIALAFALQTAAYLRKDGVTVVLSRTDDSLPGSTPADYTGDGTALTPDGVLADLQRRIDRANASGAKVLLSIHLNAYANDPSVGGTQTFYDSSRSFAAQNEEFAGLIQNTLIANLRAAGYDTPDRGITDDKDLSAESLTSFGSGYNHLVLLGPGVPGKLRASQMPGALNESFFLSDPTEASAVVQPSMQDLVARSYCQAIEKFLNVSNGTC